MSGLLPRSNAQDFQLKDYWDAFFTKRSSAFEWYGEYLDLCHILHKYLKPSSSILVAGCGNSRLSECLYDAGFHSIINIDISSVVVQQMKSKNDSRRSEMEFVKMDILDMKFDASSFDCVLDKGTLDAIFSSADNVTVQKVHKLFEEIWRVLKLAGRYICITLAQEHILSEFLKCFGTGWLLRVHKVVLEGKSESMGGALPVFVFICTKMAHKAQDIKVFEYVTDDGECVRCDSVEKVGEFVRNHQQYSMIQHHLSKLHVGETAFQMDLWLPAVPTEPRYTLSIIDQHKRKGKNGPFAVFIVPQGREVDWLFCSDTGRLQLAESAGVERLVVVTMHRGHTYSSMAQVKDEVVDKAVELLQRGLPSKKKYPVMTLGEGLGARVVLHEGCSDLSGRYVVEECEGDGGMRVRRLVFLSSPTIAQTEVRIIEDAKALKKKKKKKKQSDPKTKLDHSCLASGYLSNIVLSLAFLPQFLQEVALPDKKANSIRMLLIGLGGGALLMFITKYIQNITVDVVELDSEVVSIAERFFELTPSARFNVNVDDGIKYVNEACSAGKKDLYDVIVLDVDSKDTRVGMTCPPLQFLEQVFLESCKALLKASGMMMVNLVARNKDMRYKTLQCFHELFPSILSLCVHEDVNEMVVAMPATRERTITELVTCSHHVQDGEACGGKLLQTQCEFTTAVRHSIAGLAGAISEDSNGDIDSSTFQSDLFGSVSHLLNIFGASNS